LGWFIGLKGFRSAAKLFAPSGEQRKTDLLPSSKRSVSWDCVEEQRLSVDTMFAIHRYLILGSCH